MISNLRENFLYEKLPDAVITLDEKGLIAAVVCGFQDRVEDLRAYSSKLRFFFTVGNLPETSNNAVLVDVTTASGVVVTRSLEIHDDTPAAVNVVGLNAWVAGQLGLDPSQFTNVRYGVDMLRQVDANLLGYLADTIGAVLYGSPLSTNDTTTQQQLVTTYFPRLKIKGTVRSFEVLGRILGFDDVKVTPLWSRVSPRLPQDVGNVDNDPDFAQKPEEIPQQFFGVDYNPLATRDGSFFNWQGTVSNVQSDTQFYETVVNGFSPFITVSTVHAQGGTVTHPTTGSYALEGGDAYTKAKVAPGGSGVQFQALVQGDAYNGLLVSVVFSGTGSLAVLSILDQLSQVKYRSAFYDLALAADMDKVETIFGANAVRKNTDLASGTNTPDGVAVSPFRPWVAGSVTVPLVTQDYVTASTVTNGTTVVTARHEALPTDRELNVTQLVAAGVAVAQALEEVRPATRFPRRTNTGFLIDDKVPYAFYGTRSLLLLSSGSSPYSGIDTNRPVGPFTVDIVVVNNSGGTNFAAAVSDPNDALMWHYQAGVGPVVAGSYQFVAGSYYFTVTPHHADSEGVNIWAYYVITDTETVRPEPSFAQKDAYLITALDRPEDDWYGTNTDNELVDEYPWRRDLVNGGEVVELDTYAPTGLDIDIQPIDSECVFQDQTSAEYSVRAVRSKTTTHMRYVAEPRSTTNYVPGMLPIGYQGTFKDISTLSSDAVKDLNTFTDAETLFNPGFGLYHTGLVQGVLVSDPPKFFGEQHRAHLVGWLPFNEHPEEPLKVNDHSVVNGDQYLVGINPNDRQWDANHGWFLNLEPGALISSGDIRNWGSSQTTSFWINPTAISSSGTQTIVSSGGLSFDYAAASSFITAYVLSNGSRTPIASSLISTGSWAFVYTRRSGTQAVSGVGNLSTSAVENIITGSFDADIDGQMLLVQTGTMAVGLHDLRVWSTQKSQAHMELVRYHQPTPTVVNYPVGFMLTANEGDRYGLRVLANGWVTTDIMPAWVRRPSMALVRRYDDMGRYEGEHRFKETGLGDGPRLPTLYQLGGQYQVMIATGTQVSSTGTGQLPGINDLWLQDTAQGTYLVLVNGTGTQTVYAGGSNPWPANMVQTNPIRDYIWVTGTDGAIFELSAEGTSPAQLNAIKLGGVRLDTEITVDPVYASLFSTGTYWTYTGSHTISGTLINNIGTIIIADKGIALLQVTPSFIDFGSVFVDQTGSNNANSTAIQCFTVKNIGDSAVNGAGTLFGSGFFISSGTTYSLNPGQSQNFCVEFAPFVGTIPYSGSVIFSGAQGAVCGLSGTTNIPGPDWTQNIYFADPFGIDFANTDGTFPPELILGYGTIGLNFSGSAHWNANNSFNDVVCIMTTLTPVYTGPRAHCQLTAIFNVLPLSSIVFGLTASGISSLVGGPISSPGQGGVVIQDMSNGTHVTEFFVEAGPHDIGFVVQVQCGPNTGGGGYHTGADFSFFFENIP